MKKRILPILAALAAVLLSTACSTNQAIASATFIAAEVTTTAILQKNPQLLPLAQTLVDDWQKFQLGKLTAQDEADLLKQITAATSKKMTPVQAALLDGAVQQILANQNVTAPTALSGAAAAVITDVMNGVARALVIYVAPPTG